MNASLPKTPFYFYDSVEENLVVKPGMAGIDEVSRVCIHSRDANRYTTIEMISAGAAATIPMQTLLPIADKRIKLQLRSKEAGKRVWYDHFRLTAIEELQDMTHIRICPADWGITEDCRAMLDDVTNNSILLSEIVEAGQHVDHLCDIPPYVQRLRLSFYPASGDAGASPLIRPCRYFPPHLVGEFPKAIHKLADNLEYTVRPNVVLSPVEIIRSRPRYKYEGLFTASADGASIVEAMEFALGRPAYLLAPAGDFAESSESVVYLGPLHPSYGHFLTQSLSRAWYAALNPDRTVVWQSVGGNELRPYQREVLDLIGVKNRKQILTDATRFAEVTFPFPLIGVGDYLLKEFASFAGRVPCADMVPGKKVFLSRSKLDLGRGQVVGGDNLLDRIMVDQGYTVFHPQEHTIEQQLFEMSSAEVVVGIEGSALHSVLLLQDPIPTKFFAIARHHAGAGVFDHIKAAKPGLAYETLNLSENRPNSARQPLELDLAQLKDVLKATNGLTAGYEDLPQIVRVPATRQTNYRAHIANCKGKLTTFEADMVAAFMATKRRDSAAAELAIGNWL